MLYSPDARGPHNPGLPQRRQRCSGEKRRPATAARNNPLSVVSIAVREHVLRATRERARPAMAPVAQQALAHPLGTGEDGGDVTP